VLLLVFGAAVVGNGASLEGNLANKNSFRVVFDNLETVRFEKDKIVAGSPDAAWPVWFALKDDNGDIVLGDFEAEMEFRLIDNLTDGTWAGMVFRQQQVGDKREVRFSNAYLLAVRANGHTFLSRSGLTTLTSTTIKAPEKWYSWRESVVLKVRAVGNVIAAYVNGQEVFTYVDEDESAFMSGYFVIMANTGQTEFLNIRITKLDS
jgi:hypothetical protein